MPGLPNRVGIRTGKNAELPSSPARPTRRSRTIGFVATVSVTVMEGNPPNSNSW